MALVPIAQVSKSYGKEGEVLLKAFEQNLQEYSKEPVFIIFDGLPVPLFFEQMKPKGASSYIVKFSTIRDISHAEEIVGSKIYVESASVADELSDEAALQALEGFTLINQNGVQLGTISKVIIYPANACLEIAPSGALVPFHQDLIIELNPHSRTLTMELANGLF